MVNLINTADGGTNGTTITLGNSGGASGNGWDYLDVTGLLQFSNNGAMHGSHCIHAQGNGGKALFSWNSASVAASKKQTFRTYLKIASLPSAELQIITPRNATTYIGGVNMTTAGKLKATQLGGAGLFTTANALALNTWYRIECSYEVGTTASNGVIRFAYFLGNGATPVETQFTTTTADLGTANIEIWQMGKLSTSGSWDAYWDSIEVSTTSSALMGPFNQPLSSLRPSDTLQYSGDWTYTGNSWEAAVADESDTTYAQSAENPNTDYIVFGPNGTLAAGTPVVKARLAMSAATPALKAKISLYQGSTEVASTTVNLSTTPTDYTLSLTSAQAASITSRADLRWRITGYPV